MTPEQRSRCMAAIKGKDTKPELLVRRYLFSRGLRYRVQVKSLPGRPDIVLPKYKTVIFIDGCFWHGHEDCRYFRLPKTNIDFWRTKIERNIARDLRNEEALRALGWRVIRVWECEIKTAALREETLPRLYDSITAPFTTTVPSDTSIPSEPATPIRPYTLDPADDLPLIASEPEE